MARDVSKDRSPHLVDVAVGANIRRRRLALRMSQDALAAAIGVTFQQIQKYERGANRISCSRLMDIVRVLRVSPAQILPDIDGPDESSQPDWSADAERLFQRHERLFDSLLRLSPRQIHGLVALIEPLDRA